MTSPPSPSPVVFDGLPSPAVCGGRGVRGEGGAGSGNHKREHDEERDNGGSQNRNTP